MHPTGSVANGPTSHACGPSAACLAGRILEERNAVPVSAIRLVFSTYVKGVNTVASQNFCCDHHRPQLLAHFDGV